MIQSAEIKASDAPPVILAHQKLFGLFELDADGTIIYSREVSRLGYVAGATSAALIGRNFFDEVAPFKNVEEFRRHFKFFMRGSNSTENFTFDCRFDGAVVVPVKVKLAQISERESDERTKLVIVDIRKI